jgi:hypothetical protein
MSEPLNYRVPSLPLTCPNLDNCRLKVSEEKYETRCISGKYEGCPIYICDVLKPERIPREWRRK